MKITYNEIYADGIWISEDREKDIVTQLYQQIITNGFNIVEQNSNNFGFPYRYNQGEIQVNCRLVDSVFFTDPDSWTNGSTVTITDNHPLLPVPGKLISVLPEFWSIWRFIPQYIDRPSTNGYNCFMNRVRGDRSEVFYELIKRNILAQGIVSYNCNLDEFAQQFQKGEMHRYQEQHTVANMLIPYNTVQQHGTLEQCIIDSNISLILETYQADSHIVFSEKIFRALQMPRPWLLGCSPGAVALLKAHGFDVLDDYVDTAYDSITRQTERFQVVLDQLETFINREYTRRDYERFDQAATHNQQLLEKFSVLWPAKFNTILEEINQL
jgi:hypothetical protein